MYLAYSFGIFLISVIIMGIALRWLRMRGQPSCRGYFLGYLLVGLAPFVVTTVMTLASSLYYFEGLCYGLTDGSWDCGFWEYLSAELGYAYYFFIPAIGLAFVAITLSFAFHWFFSRRGYFKNEGADE